MDKDTIKKIINECFPTKEEIPMTTLKYNDENKFKIKCENIIQPFGLKLDKDNMVKIIKTDEIHDACISNNAALYKQDFENQKLALDCNLSSNLIFNLHKLFDLNQDMEMSVRLEEYDIIRGIHSFNSEEKERGIDFHSLKKNNFEKNFSIFNNTEKYYRLEDRFYIYSNGIDGIYFEEILENNDEKHNELFDNIRYTHMVHCMYDENRQYFTHIDYQILKYTKEVFNKKFNISITENNFKSQKASDKYKLFRIDNVKIPIENGKILFEILNKCFLNNERIVEYFYI